MPLGERQVCIETADMCVAGIEPIVDIQRASGGQPACPQLYQALPGRTAGQSPVSGATLIAIQTSLKPEHTLLAECSAQTKVAQEACRNIFASSLLSINQDR